MKHGSYLVILALAAGLVGCGNEGKFKKILGCGMAAHELEQSQASKKINQYLMKFVQDSGYRPTSADMVRIPEEIRNDDWDIPGRGADQQMKIVLRVFNSSFCQDIHGQNDLSMSDMYK
jgi:hypothetical protein